MMENAFDALRSSLSIARDVRRAADANANAMADLLMDSLRSVSPHRLVQIKRALRDFNMHTQRWSKK